MIDSSSSIAGLRFNAGITATHLNEYIEKTFNADGSTTTTELTGQHTNETFARTFPDWCAVTTIDWIRDRWSANLAFRWVDEMKAEDGSKLDSALFTDLQVRYNPSFLDDALTVAIGFINIFDEDPPVCTACGVIGMSPVSHDLPGTQGYIRVTYENN